MCGTMWRLDGPGPFLRRTYRCLPWRAAVAVMFLCPPRDSDADNAAAGDACQTGFAYLRILETNKAMP